jgi:hypothetical protein
MKISFYLVLIMSLLLAVSCSRPRSSGSPYEITVLADDQDWEKLSPEISRLFAEGWISPQDEPLMIWRRGEQDHLVDYLNRRNLMIISTGDSTGEVGEFTSGLLSAEIRDKIQREESFLFRREDAFARNQLLVILAAPTVLSFTQQVRQRAIDVRQQFLDHERSSQASKLYSALEQKDLADSLHSELGYHMRIPADWFIVQGNENPPFVRLRRLSPDRWITVHWVEGDDSLRHSESGMRKIRNHLGDHFWDKDFAEESYGRFSESKLSEYDATLFEGLWGTREFVGGGPFLLWAVYDPDGGTSGNGRTYYLDAAVLNPGGRKSPFLHQLSTIIGSLKFEK